MTGRLRLLASAVLLLTGLTACGGKGGGSGEGADGSGAVPGIGHVHGVGVDPADGSVYVAAHQGLFKVLGGNRLERVPGNDQDTMGFAIVGPRTFLASGHPSSEKMSPGAPRNLGLMRSDDAGRSWTSIPQAGKGDFHAMQPAGDTLYAYDSVSGRVLKGTNGGREWKAGATLEVVDLAASSKRANQVYATTPGGVQLSDDEGTTFAPVPGTPLLSHLDVVNDRDLVGVDTAGQVQTRAGDGSWRRLGRVPGGQVSAFTAVDARRLLAAASDGRIYESRDGGRTFSLLYDETR